MAYSIYFSFLTHNYLNKAVFYLNKLNYKLLKFPSFIEAGSESSIIKRFRGDCKVPLFLRVEKLPQPSKKKNR